MTDATNNTIRIDNIPVITLERSSLNQTSKPQLLKAIVIPSRGMHLLQITAYLPKLGIVDLLHAPDLLTAQELLEDPKDTFGNHAFSFGSAILLPFANRIRGKTTPDNQTIETYIAGRKILLPANHMSSEKLAIHGLMYATPFTELEIKNNAQVSRLSGVLHANDFNGHWPSKTDVHVTFALTDTTLEINILAKNVGEELLPMGIGMHPYFAIPSQNRTQAKLYVPAQKRALVNNYNDVFPTGQLVTVKDTPYDFTAPEGRALGSLHLDDSFTALRPHSNKNTIAILTDPLAHYGLRINTRSPAIKTVQVYAPINQNFMAIEPQFNLGDPYYKGWGEIDTGMKLLKSGENICWNMQLEIYNIGPVSKAAI